MDPKLLDAYNQQLLFMRESMGEFAQLRPKIAQRLGLQAGEVADPYVERLIESFCLTAARMQLKVDAEFPRFTQRLLEVIYPNYVAPTPSMTVVRVYPSRTEGNLAAGFHLPRGTLFNARAPDGERTACQFRSGSPLTLYPIEIKDARLTGIPPIPSLDRYVPPDRRVRGALRLTLRTTNETAIADLKNLDRLPVCLAGDDHVASHLFELLHASNIATLVGEPGQFADAGQRPAVVSDQPVAHHGLGVDEGLLPLIWSKFHGHNLLHQFFAFPSQFYFFTLTGLQAGFKRVSGREVEIIVLLDRSTDRLAHLVDASQFALFCTPAINLVPKRTDQIELDHGATTFRLEPTKLEPLDYEVFAVEGVSGQKSKQSTELPFQPLFHRLNNDEGNAGRYFSTRRERRLPSDTTRRYGTRTPYIGTDMFVSLVDQHEAPYREPIRYLSVDAWVTNRDLPLLIACNGVDDLESGDEDSIASIGLIRPPSAPRPPYAEGEKAWRLLRQLNFAYLPFSDMDHREGGQGLREMLRLFLSNEDVEQQRQVEALVGVKTQPIHDMLPPDERNGPIVFGRGIECVLTVDESGFAGVSPYLFGLILDHYLARQVSSHSFTQTELRSVQRGVIARWPVRM
ncbi:type VI secretion system baseplate subunit TssF, partial [Burkholderia sp. 8Y]|uniref:type VI secretion system baseplate subunit TssF n=1 Tax=Burkholderia sp. 8Y TaxID=2653133 RepID=UPI00135AC8C7